MFWLSIDVGGAVLGWALWFNDVLVACGLSRTKIKDCRQRAHAHRDNIIAALLSRCAWPGRVVVEMGTWRGRSTKRKMTPQQLADFNLIAGFLGTHWYTPREWKGDLDRAAEQAYTRGALGAPELALLDAVKPTSLAHNTCSAVGVGLAFLKRAHRPAGVACQYQVEQPTTSSKRTRKNAARKATSRGTTSRKVSARTGTASRTPSSSRRSNFRMTEALLQ